MLYRSWIRNPTLKITEIYGDNHWTNFESCRKKHNDNLCDETNKLVLRLDKLVGAVENGTVISDKNVSDLNKSMDIEWTPDDLVKLCPYCAKKFSFALRRHHCRLCGAILCNSCSRFLEFKAACKLVKPAKLYTDPYDRIEDRIQNNSASDGKPRIRLCEDCKRLLDKRLQTIEDHYCQPTFLDLYDTLKKAMSETDELLLSQLSLSTRTSPKETAQELKGKIQDLRQIVAKSASNLKKLAEKESKMKQAHLLKSIHESVIHWLSESMDKKEQRVLGSIAHQSKAGWVPELPACGGEAANVNENPLLVQIRNLEEYIRQAKLADRYEEVGALEASKRDLEIEYLLQQDLAVSLDNEEKSGANEEIEFLVDKAESAGVSSSDPTTSSS